MTPREGSGDWLITVVEDRKRKPLLLLRLCWYERFWRTLQMTACNAAERVTPVRIFQRHTGDVAVIKFSYVFHSVLPGRKEKKPGGDKVMVYWIPSPLSTLQKTRQVHTYEGISSSHLSRDGHHQELWLRGCSKWNQEGVMPRRFLHCELALRFGCLCA